MTQESQEFPPQSLPWRTRVSMSMISAVTDATCRSNGTINRRLINFFDRKVLPQAVLNGVKSSDVIVDPNRNLWFRLYLPPTNDHVPVVVFFHGGGFAFFGPDSTAYDAVCRRLSRDLPAVVVSVNYRLAPEHKFPSQYEDGFDVLKYLDEDPTRLPHNADPTRVFLAGDSAGGNLAHHVVLKACGVQLKSVKIAGLILIQPFFGGLDRSGSEIRLIRAPLVSVRRTDWMWKAFLPYGADRSHEACDVYGSNRPDLSGMDYPPSLVVVGGLDPLQDWQRKFYDWLKKSEKEVSLMWYPTACHAFYVFPELPESSLLVAEIRQFVREKVTSM